MTAPDDRVAEIRQRLEAATGVHRVIVDALDLAPGQPAVLFDVVCDAVEGSDLADRCHMIGTPAADDEADLAWLLSRLAVVEAERDEMRAKVAELDAQVAGHDPTAHTLPHLDGGECLCECRRCWRDDHCVCRDCSGEGHDHSRRALSGTTEGPS